MSLAKGPEVIGVYDVSRFRPPSVSWRKPSQAQRQPPPDVYLTDTLLTLESKNNYMYERLNTGEAGVWWALRRVVLWRASLKPLSVLRIKGKLRKSRQFIARS